jgi:hypothetical protein
MTVREERDHRANSVAWTQGERLASATGDNRRLPRARSSLPPWTDRRAQSQTGRVRRALIALTLIVVTGVAVTGVVIAEELFWVDQAEQAHGLMDGE